MKQVSIRIGGMHCIRCSETIAKSLNKVSGVIRCNVNFASSRANVIYDESLINYKEICKIIRKSGYKVISNDSDKEFRVTLYTFIVSFILLIPFIIMMLLMLVGKHDNIFHNGYFQLIFATLIQFGVGYKFYKGAIKSVKNKNPNMDLLIAMGTSVAYFYSLYNLIRGIKVYYFESCAFVITLVYFGNLLEMKSKNKANEALSSLLQLQPSVVTIIENNELKEIDILELKKDDIFLVRAYETIASDGVVVDGSSSVDESMLTGESMLVNKELNSVVFGGTRNTNGVLRVKSSGTASDNVLAKIIGMIEEAETSKANIERIADKVSSYFVPFIIVTSVFCFLINYLLIKDVSISISRAIAVLVIACPCSLGLATPTALIVGMGIAYKKGILVKNANALEKMYKLKTIVLDKTGTITDNSIEVSNVVTYDYSLEKVGEIVSALENNSNHPLAKCMVNYFKESKLKISKVKEIPGKGMEGFYDEHLVKIGSVNYLKEYIKDEVIDNDVVVVLDDRLIATISFQDRIKENARDVLTKLKNEKIEVVLASGDNSIKCEEVSKKVGISKVYSEISPFDKNSIINEYKSKGIVAMVGDGINDSIALSSADIGISMGNGSEVALNSSDIVIMNDDLDSIYKAFIISKKTISKVKQNLFWAFFYNTISIPLACVGILSPIVAGLCMSLSSVSVISNSLLLNISIKKFFANKKCK